MRSTGCHSSYTCKDNRRVKIVSVQLKCNIDCRVSPSPSPSVPHSVRPSLPPSPPPLLPSVRPSLSLSLSFSLHLTAIFQVHLPGSANTRTSPFLILLELRVTELAVITGAIRLAKLQSKCHHYQQTNTQFLTGRMPFMSPNQQCQRTEGKSFAGSDETYFMQ